MKIDKEKVSYVLGQSVGGDFRRNKFEIDTDVFTTSFTDAYNGQESKIRPSEMQHIMMNFQQSIKEKQQNPAAENNISEGKVFLEENNKKKDVITTESGLQYKIITKGDGEKPTINNKVTTHYEGKTLDGKIFDSSYKRGTPANFPVNGVIKGWQEALQLMPQGSKWKLYIPSHLAYGLQGSGSQIGPHATLVFDIELISID